MKGACSFPFVLTLSHSTILGEHLVHLVVWKLPFTCKKSCPTLITKESGYIGQCCWDWEHPIYSYPLSAFFCSYSHYCIVMWKGKEWLFYFGHTLSLGNLAYISGSSGEWVCRTTLCLDVLTVVQFYFAVAYRLFVVIIATSTFPFWFRVLISTLISRDVMHHIDCWLSTVDWS